LLLLIPFSCPTSRTEPGDRLFHCRGHLRASIGELGYVGIERIGVARSVPIVNSSPIVASIFAVVYLGELWVLQNIAGTCLVILGVIMLSMVKPADKPWRKLDIIYPVLGAIAFGVSANLRKAGLDVVNIPILAAATTASTAAYFPWVFVFRGKEVQAAAPGVDS
jgi:uncharacterized membrane protein